MSQQNQQSQQSQQSQQIMDIPETEDVIATATAIGGNSATILTLEAGSSSLNGTNQALVEEYQAGFWSETVGRAAPPSYYDQ